MEIGSQVAVYVPSVGKKKARQCSAPGYYAASQNAEYENIKAEADVYSEELCSLADVEWGADWVYRGTLKIGSNRFHHYVKTEGSKENHLWVMISEFKS